MRQSWADVRILFTIGVVALVAMPACGRRDAHAIAAPTTRAAAASTQSTTAPATQRSPAVFTIDGKRYAFPPARLQVLKRGAGLTLVLSSDDPAGHAEDDHTNSFYFQMLLSIDDADDLPAARWRYKLDPDRTEDNLDGIFVNDGATQIAPVEAEATFERSGDDIVITLHGQFTDMGDEDAARSRRMDVSGKLAAVPE